MLIVDKTNVEISLPTSEPCQNYPQAGHKIITCISHNMKHVVEVI